MSRAATLRDYLNRVTAAETVLSKTSPQRDSFNMMHDDRRALLEETHDSAPPAMMAALTALTNAVTEMGQRVHVAGNTPRRDGAGPGPNGNGRPERRCYNCNGMGHLSAECTAPCKICKAADHRSGSCPQRRKRKTPANGSSATPEVAKKD